MVDVQLAVVGPSHLEDVGRLFAGNRTTSRCWCMAFCCTGRQFAVGWYTGGNRRRFEAMAAHGPMGVLAMVDGEPVGWCACGPRSRFRAAEHGRGGPLAGRPRDDDASVWLLACTFITPDRRGQGLLLPLLRGALTSPGSRVPTRSRPGRWRPGCVDAGWSTSAGKTCSSGSAFARWTGRCRIEPSSGWT